MAQALQHAQMPYGAFELKSTYQRNMIMGTAFSALLTALVVFSVWIYNVITYQNMEPTNVIRIKTIADLGAPPSLQAKPPQIDIAKPNVAAPKIGIPKPVAEDEVVDENVVIASREELQEINAPVLSGNEGENGSKIVIDIPQDDYMPSPDEFIPVEEQPVQIYEEIPEYPRLAQDGGFTGSVWVQAFVDKDGNVKKAQAVKCNRPNMGFEDAAVAAAYKCKYRPAIQNGNPIGVWIQYKVEFTLNK
jgi:TonB family protein